MIQQWKIRLEFITWCACCDAVALLEVTTLLRFAFEECGLASGGVDPMCALLVLL